MVHVFPKFMSIFSLKFLQLILERTWMCSAESASEGSSEGSDENSQDVSVTPTTVDFFSPSCTFLLCGGSGII